MIDTRELLIRDTQAIDVSSAVDKGVGRCRKGDWATGLELLRKVARKEEKGIKLPSIYYSYLGYGAARFEGEHKDGLALCLHAVKVGRNEPENYLNLARIYLLAGDRRRAVTAVKRGLKIDAHHIPLMALRTSMGYRGKPVIRFLSRDAWINRLLGKRRHRRLKIRQALN